MLEHIAAAPTETVRSRLTEAESAVVRETTRPFPFSGSRAHVTVKAIRERDALKNELARRN